MLAHHRQEEIKRLTPPLATQPGNPSVSPPWDLLLPPRRPGRRDGQPAASTGAHTDGTWAPPSDSPGGGWAGDTPPAMPSKSPHWKPRGALQVLPPLRRILLPLTGTLHRRSAHGLPGVTGRWRQRSRPRAEGGRMHLQRGSRGNCQSRPRPLTRGISHLQAKASCCQDSLAEG